MSCLIPSSHLHQHIYTYIRVYLHQHKYICVCILETSFLKRINQSKWKRTKGENLKSSLSFYTSVVNAAYCLPLSKGGLNSMSWPLTPLSLLNPLQFDFLFNTQAAFRNSFFLCFQSLWEVFAHFINIPAIFYPGLYSLFPWHSFIGVCDIIPSWFPWYFPDCTFQHLFLGFSPFRPSKVKMLQGLIYAPFFRHSTLDYTLSRL